MQEPAKRSPAPHLRPIRPPHIAGLSESLLRFAYLNEYGALVNIYSLDVMPRACHPGERLRNRPHLFSGSQSGNVPRYCRLSCPDLDSFNRANNTFKKLPEKTETEYGSCIRLFVSGTGEQEKQGIADNMVSGKYSALSGAISREQAMANISNNLANVNSSGFKKNRISFEAMLKGSQQVSKTGGINYNRIRKIGTDFTQGPLMETGRPLDVAISGKGFFKVQRGRETLYTRNGNFFTDTNGMLKTAQGFTVLNESNNPIQLINTAGKIISIDESGAITLDTTPSGERIQVFSVSDPQRLSKAGDGLFRAEPGVTSRPTYDSPVVQKSLEGSNVNMVEEMVMMIDTQRKFEAFLKVQKSYSRLGERQSELGTVG
ncbi:MAG TPA: flagellar basal-body rod protein FlgF [Desulfobulbus sp.]|nr:flagellar basal-body rod protein FlgF [Desulfobulbus sp.]